MTLSERQERLLDSALVAGACVLTVFLWETVAALPMLLAAQGVPVPAWALLATIPLLLGGFFWWLMGPFARPERRVRRRAYRLESPGGGWGWIALGVALSLVFEAALFMILVRFMPPEEIGSGPWDLLLSRPSGRASLFFGVLVFAPLVEEILLRGRLQRSLEELWGPTVAVGVTALIFALLHFKLAQAPVFFVSGVILGTMAWLTASVWPAVALHALMNSMGAVLFPAFPDSWREALLRPEATVGLTVAALTVGYLLVRLGRYYHATFRDAAAARERMGP